MYAGQVFDPLRHESRLNLVAIADPGINAITKFLPNFANPMGASINVTVGKTKTLSIPSEQHAWDGSVYTISINLEAASSFIKVQDKSTFVISPLEASLIGSYNIQITYTNNENSALNVTFSAVVNVNPAISTSIAKTKPQGSSTIKAFIRRISNTGLVTVTFSQNMYAIGNLSAVDGDALKIKVLRSGFDIQ